MSAPDVQENINALFLLDYTELQIAKNRDQVEKPSEGVKKLAVDLDIARLTETMRILTFLVKNIPIVMKSNST